MTKRAAGVLIAAAVVASGCAGGAERMTSAEAAYLHFFVQVE
jgi:hypothetical protein